MVVAHSLNVDIRRVDKDYLLEKPLLKPVLLEEEEFLTPIQPRADGRETKWNNLVTLCKYHCMALHCGIFSYLSLTFLIFVHLFICSFVHLFICFQ